MSDDGSGSRDWKETRRRPPQDLESWFRRRLASLVAEGLPQWSRESQSQVVSWLAAHDEGVLVWCDDVEYKERGYARGWWTVDAAKVKALLPEACESVRVALEAAQFPTIESWLAGLFAGQLVTTPIAEPHAESLVTDPEAFRLHRVERKRRCRCGNRIAGDRRQKRCAECRARAQAKQQEEEAARAVGARFLRAMLARHRIDPFAFPSGQPYFWLTHERVQGYLAGHERPSGIALKILCEHYWPLDRNVREAVQWAFRPRSRWPERLRRALTRRLAALQELPP